MNLSRWLLCPIGMHSWQIVRYLADCPLHLQFELAGADAVCRRCDTGWFDFEDHARAHGWTKEDLHLGYPNSGKHPS